MNARRFAAPCAHCPGGDFQCPSGFLLECLVDENPPMPNRLPRRWASPTRQRRMAGGWRGLGVQGTSSPIHRTTTAGASSISLSDRGAERLAHLQSGNGHAPLDHLPGNTTMPKRLRFESPERNDVTQPGSKTALLPVHRLWADRRFKVWRGRSELVPRVRKKRHCVLRDGSFARARTIWAVG